MGSYPTPQPAPYQPGAFTRLLVWLFGSHYKQIIHNGLALMQLVVSGISSGTLYSTTYINSLGFPWLAKHWIQILALANLTNALMLFISSRNNQPKQS